ncbi:MAG: nodulation protein NfeD [Deltaproteobacteria bacterium]|nr:MAG: nodulation protein NfeD [Deltaproteobacteria bacterium]
MLRFNVKKTILFLLILVFFSPALVFGGGDHINVINVSDSINPGTAEFIEKAIKKSETDGAACLVIKLDTPGGLVTSMKRIVKAILNSEVPVVVYVAPSGAQAASAGTMITLAAHIAAMAPGTNIGAAHPVGPSGKDVEKTMSEKIVNDLVAFTKSIAAQRKRNLKWVEKAIRKSESITASEALKLKVIDIVAKDMDELIKKIDGRKVKLIDKTVVLKVKELPLVTIEETFRDKILRTLSNPNIAYILMMIGLAGLYFELAHPGAILPGVIGGIALILAFFAFQTLPVNYAGFLLIALAIIFFILEIKVTSYGMLSIAGVVSLILGSLMIFPGKQDYLRISYQVLVPTVIAVSLFFVTVASLAFKAQIAKPRTGTAGLIGEVGEVMEVRGGRLKVFVHGEIWNAESSEPVNVGEMVKVVGVENLKLRIQRVDSG